MLATQHGHAALEAVRRAATELEVALGLLERGDPDARRLAAQWRDERWILHDLQQLAESIERLSGDAHARDRLERLLAIAGIRHGV